MSYDFNISTYVINRHSSVLRLGGRGEVDQSWGDVKIKSVPHTVSIVKTVMIILNIIIKASQ